MEDGGNYLVVAILHGQRDDRRVRIRRETFGLRVSAVHKTGTQEHERRVCGRNDAVDHVEVSPEDTDPGRSHRPSAHSAKLCADHTWACRETRRETVAPAPKKKAVR